MTVRPAVAGLARRNRGQKPVENLYAAPSSLDWTGATDESADFHTWLSGVPDGTPERPNRVQWPASGTLTVDRGVQVHQRKHLVVDLNGGTVQTSTDGTGTVAVSGYSGQWPKARSTVFINLSTGITTRNGTVVGDNSGGGENGTKSTALEGQHGVRSMFSAGCHVHDLDIKETWGDLVYFLADDYVINSLVERCECHHNGRQGIANVGGQHLTIRDCDIYEIKFSAVDYEPHPGHACNYQWLVGNTFSAIKHNIVAAHGYDTGDVSHVHIVGNVGDGHVIHVTAGGSALNPRSHWTVAGNSSDVTNTGTLASLSYIRDVLIEGNDQVHGVGTTAVRVTGTKRAIVRGNNLRTSGGVPSPIEVTQVSPTPFVDTATALWTPSDYLTEGLAKFYDTALAGNDLHLEFGDVVGYDPAGDAADPDRATDGVHYYLDFDGADDYTSRASETLLDVTTGTFAFVVVAEFPTLSGVQVVASKRDGAGAGWELFVDGTAFKVRASDGVTTWTSTNATTLATGTKYTLSARRLSSGFYGANVNATGIGTYVATDVAASWSNTAPLQLGVSGADDSFAGMKLYGAAWFKGTPLAGVDESDAVGGELLFLAEVKD